MNLNRHIRLNWIVDQFLLLIESYFQLLETILEHRIELFDLVTEILVLRLALSKRFLRVFIQFDLLLQMSLFPVFFEFLEGPIVTFFLG